MEESQKRKAPGEHVQSSSKPKRVRNFTGEHQASRRVKLIRCIHINMPYESCSMRYWTHLYSSVAKD
eukprot:3933077-Karenia_brevis.AAC.1